MPISLSARQRGLLSQSLLLAERSEDALIDRMSSCLRASDRGGADNSEMIAMMLVDLMLTHANNLARSGPAADPAETRREHDALGIQGRHYSLFGDALGPILDDLLGPNLPRTVAGAWCDAFWALIRVVQAERAALLDA